MNGFLNGQMLKCKHDDVFLLSLDVINYEMKMNYTYANLHIDYF